MEVTSINTSRIEDDDLVQRYNQEFQGNYFIPESENKTFDDENLMNRTYVESSKKIGGQIIPIAVAVCDDDKYKDSEESSFRIHGRIIDGRHRYIQSKAQGIDWKVSYFRVSSFEEYMILRSHFDSKKKENPEEQRVKFLELAEYMFAEKGVPKQDIGKMIVEQYSPTPYSSTAIRNWLPDEYKDQEQAEKRKGKTKPIEETKKGKEIAKKLDSVDKKKIKELQTLYDDSLRQNTELKESYDQEHNELSTWREREPFLLSEPIVTIEGTENEMVKISIDLNTKSFTVKKI
jgi:hypothetical protein